MLSTVNTVGGNPNYCLKTETYSDNSVVKTGLNYQSVCNTLSGGTKALCDGNFYETCRTYFKPAKISSGGSFTCLTQTYNSSDAGSGSAYCWGAGNYGKIGNNSTNIAYSPSKIYPSWDNYNFVMIAAGSNNGCAIKNNGVMYCWGRNDKGQVGNGTTISPVTQKITVSGTWKTVSVGNDKACAIKNDDTLWCWGESRLGDGTNNNSSSPIQIATGSTWKMISVGHYHGICGIKTDNTLWCWGNNTSGMLGLGDTTVRSTPTQVGNATWNYVDIGPYHACGIKTDGTLWCWGANDRGQYGNGTYSSSSSPVQVSSNTNWIKVEAGGPDYQGLTCAMKNDNSLWCAGNNDWGAIGNNGGGSTQSVSTLNQVSGVWYDFSVGNSHNVCGIKQESNVEMRAVYCWGYNTSGETGIGTSYSQGTADEFYGSPQKSSDYWRSDLW